MDIDTADYDKSDYDYIRFWQVRQYENQSEQIVLKKLLPKAGESLIDLGGGFGRLANFYSPCFSRCVLLDYSEKNLKQAQILTETAGIANLEIKRGDVYDLPFQNSEFEVALMVRVVHHLLEPQKVISEAARILQKDGIFILEFANKIHLKARIKAWLRGDLKFSKNREPLRAKEGAGILINYHPKHIQEMLENTGFTIEKKVSVSNFRAPIFKKFIPLSSLLFLESFFQKISMLSLSRFYFGPSIFFKCRKTS